MPVYLCFRLGCLRIYFTVYCVAIWRNKEGTVACGRKPACSPAAAESSTSYIDGVLMSWGTSGIALSYGSATSVEPAATHHTHIRTVTMSETTNNTGSRELRPLAHQAFFHRDTSKYDGRHITKQTSLTSNYKHVCCIVKPMSVDERFLPREHMRGRSWES